MLLPLRSGSTGAAETFDPFAGPRPIAVLIETNPWAMVIGSDNPRLALYEDGEIIFARETEKSISYHHRKLEPTTLKNFQEQIESVARLEELKRHYRLVSSTDQPSTSLYLKGNAKEVVTSIYGLTCARSARSVQPSSPAMPKPDELPSALVNLHKLLCGVDLPESDPWTPRFVEVMLWDYSYAPDKSIPWPKEWPDFNSDRAIKRGDSFSIFLDGTELPRLKEFIANRPRRGAVELDGKKWAVQARYTFPSESVWRAAFKKPVQ
jgi:hypothetical protein